MTVSKAANRSSSIRKTDFLLSRADRMSFVTRVKAVSVECPLLYADCRGSIKSLASICIIIVEATTRSITFDMKGRFDTGL